MSTIVSAAKGLEGIVAANSGICFIDGERGVLAYRGYDIHDLADHSTFEEVCYLLWFGRLPNRRRNCRIYRFPCGERANSTLASSVCSGRRQGTRCPWMSCRTVVSALAFFDPEEKTNDHGATFAKRSA